MRATDQLNAYSSRSDFKLKKKNKGISVQGRETQIDLPTPNRSEDKIILSNTDQKDLLKYYQIKDVPDQPENDDLLDPEKIFTEGTPMSSHFKMNNGKNFE